MLPEMLEPNSVLFNYVGVLYSHFRRLDLHAGTPQLGIGWNYWRKHYARRDQGTERNGTNGQFRPEKREDGRVSLALALLQLLLKGWFLSSAGPRSSSFDKRF